MNLDGWTHLFEFGHGLYVYAKNNERVGVNKQGKVIVEYRMDAESRRNPRCKECLEQQVKGKGGEDESINIR